jgi:hypothetical protein
MTFEPCLHYTILFFPHTLHLNNCLYDENKSLENYNVSHEDVLELHIGKLEEC